MVHSPTPDGLESLVTDAFVTTWDLDGLPGSQIRRRPHCGRLAVGHILCKPDPQGPRLFLALTRQGNISIATGGVDLGGSGSLGPGRRDIGHALTVPDQPKLLRSHRRTPVFSPCRCEPALDGRFVGEAGGRYVRAGRQCRVLGGIRRRHLRVWLFGVGVARRSQRV